MIHFSHLYTLLALVPLAAIMIYLGARKRRFPIVRGAILALAVLALAGPFLAHETTSHTILFLVDRSASVTLTSSDEQVQSHIQTVMDSAADAQFGVIEFAKTATVTVPLGTAPLTLGMAALDDSVSSLRAAVDLGLSLVPEGEATQFVLVSDGRFSDLVENALSQAQLAGVPISVLPIGHDVPSDMSVASLSAPNVVQVGRPFDVVAEVRSSGGGTARLVFYRDDDIVSVEELDLVPGTTEVSITDTMEQLGAAVYQVVVKGPSDPVSANDDLSIHVRSTEAPTVLVIDRNETSHVSNLLDALGITHTTVGRVPALEILSEYRQVILASGRLQDVTTTEIDALAQFVRHLGGGILVVNGEEEISAFRDGAIENLLPVTFNVPEKTEEASLAIVYLLDRSASMRSRVDGVEKIDVLKEAAIASINLLDEEALVGIVAFDRVFDWVLPIAPIDFGAIASALHPMDAIGGTDIYFPLVDALDRLADVEARSKHILLISDGKAGDEVRDYPGLVQRLASDPGTTLSAIAVGSAPNTTLLGTLVTAGGGTLYLADDFSTLPQVSIRATQRLSRERTVSDETVVEGRLAAQLAPDEIPPLAGYVVSYPKESAQTLLWGGDDPVVSTWRIGLGTVTVLNTDLNGQWTHAWFEWSGLPRLFDEILATTRPDTVSTLGLTASVTFEGAATSLVVDARQNDGAYADFLDIRSDLLPAEMTYELNQVAPGLYHVQFPTPSKGGYTIYVEDTTRDRSLSVPLCVPYSSEYAVFGPDASTLSWIADATGGCTLTEGLSLPDTAEAALERITPLQDVFMLGALGLFLLELALRKWPLHRRRNTPG